MNQMVFIHGPGAGGCAESFVHQLEHYSGSLAPTLPGHLEGKACASVERYTEWLRGWLWSKGKRQDLVLVGFTLGACIAPRVRLGLSGRGQGAGPHDCGHAAQGAAAQRSLERFGSRRAQDPESNRQWLDLMRHNMKFIEPGLRERLVECHRKVGPMSQHDDFVVIDQFDVRDRIGTLKPRLLLIRGADDPGSPPEYEMEIHLAVAGSRYLKLSDAGHFPMAEKPEEFNRAIDQFLES